MNDRGQMAFIIGTETMKKLVFIVKEMGLKNNSNAVRTLITNQYKELKQKQKGKK